MLQPYIQQQQQQQQQQPETPQAAVGSPADPIETPATTTASVYVPGYAFADCENCPQMVVLPGGLYQMGSPAAETGRGRDEGPQHEVSIAPFAIGKFEVTFAQWDACLAGGGCNGYSPPDRGWGRGNRPVTDISWDDAQAYLDWLNHQVGGLRYRLASEAEWEYAARQGGKKVRFGNGKDMADPKTINFNGGKDYKLPYSIAGEYRGKTVPVGSLNSPNALGLHDMSGNLWEWCWDWDANYTSTAEINPKGPDNGSYRVGRGGAWDNNPSDIRCSCRYSDIPDGRGYNMGFRLARAVR